MLCFAAAGSFGGFSPGRTLGPVVAIVGLGDAGVDDVGGTLRGTLLDGADRLGGGPLDRGGSPEPAVQADTAASAEQAATIARTRPIPP